MKTLERLKRGEVAVVGTTAFTVALYVELHPNDRFSARAIATDLGLSRGAILNAIRVLESAGWIDQATDPLGTAIALKVDLDRSTQAEVDLPRSTLDEGRSGSAQIHPEGERYHEVDLPRSTHGEVDLPRSTHGEVDLPRSTPGKEGGGSAQIHVRKAKRDGTGRVLTRARAPGLLGRDHDLQEGREEADPLTLGDPCRSDLVDPSGRRGSADADPVDPVRARRVSLAAQAPEGGRSASPMRREVKRLTTEAGGDPKNPTRKLTAEERRALASARAKREEERTDFTAPEVVALFRAAFFTAFDHDDPETATPKARNTAADRVRDLAAALFEHDLSRVRDYLRWIVRRWVDAPASKGRVFAPGATPSLRMVLKPESVFIREFLAKRQDDSS